MHGLFASRIQIKAELDGKAHGSQHTHRVFAKSRFRVPDEPEPACFMIRHAAGIIDHRKVFDVVIQGIDREVPAPHIFFYLAVSIIPQQAPFLIQQGFVVLLVAGTAKGGNFNDFPSKMHMGEAKSASDQAAIAEYFSDLIWIGIGDHIKILGLPPQQQITDTAADQICLKAGFLQPIQYLQGIFADLGPRNIVFRTRVDPDLCSNRLRPAFDRMNKFFKKI